MKKNFWSFTSSLDILDLKSKKAKNRADITFYKKTVILQKLKNIIHQSFTDINQKCYKYS